VNIIYNFVKYHRCTGRQFLVPKEFYLIN